MLFFIQVSTCSIPSHVSFMHVLTGVSLKMELSQSLIIGTFEIFIFKGLGKIASSLKNFSIFCCTSFSVVGLSVVTCWLMVVSSISAGFNNEISSIVHLNFFSDFGVEFCWWKTLGLKIKFNQYINLRLITKIHTWMWVNVAYLIDEIQMGLIF